MAKVKLLKKETAPEGILSKGVPRPLNQNNVGQCRYSMVLLLETLQEQLNFSNKRPMIDFQRRSIKNLYTLEKYC